MHVKTTLSQKGSSFSQKTWNKIYVKINIWYFQIRISTNVSNNTNVKIVLHENLFVLFWIRIYLILQIVKSVRIWSFFGSLISVVGLVMEFYLVYLFLKFSNFSRNSWVACSKAVAHKDAIAHKLLMNL